MQWARSLFKEKGCGLIINDGDFLDSDVIKSETSHVIAEIFKDNAQEEILLLGNHEMRDANGQFNSLSILSNYPKLRVINKLTKITLSDGTNLIFQPYTSKMENIKKLTDLLDETKGKKILFSHLTYSNLPDVYMPGLGEIDYNVVKDRADLIFNGHIHTAFETANFIQVGTLTGLNFSDDYTYHRPGVIIFNTETLTWERIENPKAILYQKTNVTNLKNLKDLDRSIIRVDCPAGQSEKIREQLEKVKCLRYKLKVLVDENTKVVAEDKPDFNLYTNATEALKDFIKIDKSIYSEEQLSNFIQEYVANKKEKTSEDD